MIVFNRPHLDAEAIEALITLRTKMIVPVHYAGVHLTPNGTKSWSGILSKDLRFKVLMSE